MRKFNTSGPNIPEKHYTIRRVELIRRGLELVQDERYFTLWAPRQTGKSTFYRQLAEELEQGGYKVAHINFENYRNEPLRSFLSRLASKLEEFWGDDFRGMTLGEIFQKIEQNNKEKRVLVIDEVEGINKEYFGDFLHAIRSAYHARQTHGLKSVILVGVSNIVGLVRDNASPFNVADNLNVPYFTDKEVDDLLSQHEAETGQKFERKVKRKMSSITANQPGLINGFAKKIVEDNPHRKRLGYSDYLKVEDWYLTEAIDKNFSNILNKATEERAFVERLLFTDAQIPFEIDRESISLLHTNGLIKKDEKGFVEFWVPFYKKRLYKAFYPYTNGEQRKISRTIFAADYFTEEGDLKLDRLVENYKEYIQRRGFGPFREKDEKGNFKSIKEAALIYSFETYIHAFVTQTEGKIYREAQTGLGKSDIILNINNREYLIETKIYYAPKQFEDGKRQLAYYCKSLGLRKGVYLVYCPNGIAYPDFVKEQTQMIGKIEIASYLVAYDEGKW